MTSAGDKQAPLPYTRRDATEISGLAELNAMLRTTSRATDPAEMLASMSPWFRRLNRSDFYVSASRRGLPAPQYKITRAILNTPDVDRQQSSANSNPWRDWSKIPAHEGGLIGELLANDAPVFLQNLAIDDDPVLGVAIRDMRSVLAIPNYDAGEALNWGIYFRRDPAGWSDEEIPRIMQETNVLGLATKNLVERRRANDLNGRLHEQLERVAQVQRALLPACIPEIDGYALATSYLTSDDAGGDYYDFFRFPDGSYGVLIADVSGHGAAAATVMAMLRAILHGYERNDFSPAAVMRYANKRLVDAGLEGMFTTAFFATLDPASGELVYARCGHNPPRVVRTDGSLAVIDGAGSLPLGILEDAPIVEDRVSLEPGDALTLYTDGITEAFAPVNALGSRDLFGEHRLDGALRTLEDRSPQGIVDAIHAALYAHVGSMTRDDDQTLVILRREPSA